MSAGSMLDEKHHIKNKWDTATTEEITKDILSVVNGVFYLEPLEKEMQKPLEYFIEDRVDRPHFRTLEKKNKKKHYK